MKHIPPFLLLSTLFAAPLTHAHAQAPATAAPAVAPAPLPAQPPDIAAPKMDPKTGEPQAGFMAAHEKFLTIAKEGKAHVVFLGDSITAGWAGAGKEVWERTFSKWNSANFGIGGDRTQHVLWRIENGELEGIKPEVAVIMIGTNNTGGDSAESIASGVTKIVTTVRAKLPATQILLLAVFPRGSKPDGKLGASYEKIKEINSILAKLDDRKTIHFLDIGDKFIQGKDALSAEIMPDFLHLSPAGYQIWAEAITPKLSELTK
jgi:lysophospholipase L1-like esterase